MAAGVLRRRSWGGPKEVPEEIEEEKAWLGRALRRCYSFLSSKELRHNQSRKTEQGALPQPQQLIEQLHQKKQLQNTPKTTTSNTRVLSLKEKAGCFLGKGQQVTLDLVKTAFTMRGCEDA